MILYTPDNFDKNEWFILCSIGLMFLLIWLIPKRLHFVEVLSLWLLNLFLAHSVDYSVVRQPINLYFSNDIKRYEIFDFLLYYFLYPSSLYLFFTGLASWHFFRRHWFLYVCGASAVTTGLEKIAQLMGVFTYIHWSTWYSLIAYILLYCLNVGFYHFVRKHAEQFHIQKNIN